MVRTHRIATFALWLGLCAGAERVGAQITVEGVTDETVYADSAAFRVPAAAGYDYTVELNGVAQPTGVMVDVDQADYYELSVRRRNQSNGAVETALVQFIVRSSERENSEWGLPPWVPYPRIPSAAAEFAGATLRIIAPQAYPQGLQIPVAAWVENGAGKRVGVNGLVTASSYPSNPLDLFRGVGSVLLPAATNAGPIDYTATIQTLQTPRVINIEASTAWTATSGAINASADWGENARRDVTADITVAAGATLTIGAGSVVRLAAGADITVNGTLVVNGTPDRPVVFTPRTGASPWGGLILRTNASRLNMTGAILTGSGADPDWFGNNPGSGSSHRDEQPLVYLQNGARATLTDCYLIHNRGQGGHGESSFLTMTHCLVQRAITCGQYNSGSVTLTNCALIEFPADGAPFADDDNDALYLTGGSHSLTDCLIGWAGDDGTDSGSGSAGSVTVTRCWYESCFHEGMAWSETRLPAVRDTVVTNCGQGIECGFGEPMVDAMHVLSTANLSGVRFGDNYDWDYNGFLTVTDSLLLFNRRDIWGRAWDNWTEHLAQMDIQGNFLTAADPNHPNNSAWQPAVDAPRLIPFLPTPATTVGVGIALRQSQADLSELAHGVPVRLSTFTTIEVSVDYQAVSEDGPLGAGTLTFVPGETLKRIDLDIPDLASLQVVRLTLVGTQGGELTGLTEAFYTNIAPVALIPTGSMWKYRDTGVSQGTAWRLPGFNDDSWPEGRAELGCCEGDEQTEVNIGPDQARFPTIYFRRRFEVADPAAFVSLTINVRRDDGAVVYLNGEDVFRTNMPEPPAVIEFTTPADSSSTSETAFFSMEIGTELLVPGTNTIAVEVHQANATSSDLSFELELLGNVPPPILGGGFVRGDTNADRVIDVSDPVKALFVLFLQAPTDCEDALDANDSGTLNLADALYLLNFLFTNGPTLPAPFPAAGSDATADALDCDRL